MKWEYATESAEADFLDLALSNRDKNGWEFVALSVQSLRTVAWTSIELAAAEYRLVFRRPVQ